MLPVDRLLLRVNKEVLRDYSTDVVAGSQWFATRHTTTGSKSDALQFDDDGNLIYIHRVIRKRKRSGSGIYILIHHRPLPLFPRHLHPHLHPHPLLILHPPNYSYHLPKHFVDDVPPALHITL